MGLDFQVKEGIKNRLDKGPRNINEELVNKIKSLS